MSRSLMQLAHIMAAALAVWRITDLMTQDRITVKFREKFPIYLWTCPRCFSVWASIWATVMFCVFPWANWPFALAWVYQWHIDSVIAKRMATKGRQFSVELTNAGTYNITRLELNRQEITAIIDKVYTQVQGQVN